MFHSHSHGVPVALRVQSHVMRERKRSVPVGASVMHVHVCGRDLHSEKSTARAVENQFAATPSLVSVDAVSPRTGRKHVEQCGCVRVYVL